MKILTAIASLLAALGAMAVTLAGAEQAVVFAPIDMTKPLLDETDRPVKDTASPEAVITPYGVDCSKCPLLTIGIEINRALALWTASSTTMAPDDKWAAGALGLRIIRGDAVILLPAEVVLIKAALGKFPGLPIARIFPLIDPAAAANPPKVR